MKIAFFGTPDFTVEFLELFKSLGIQIVLVVTAEDKPVGRGMQMKKPGPATFAITSARQENMGIKLLQPKKLDEEFWTEYSKLEIDLNIVIAYGKIIPEKIINFPKLGTINLHYSLLPKYRGASPVETAILNGDTETGITIQQMVYKLDAGNILFQEKIGIDDNETTSELRARMNKRALEIFPEFLKKEWEGVVQDETQATSCGKFLKDDLNVTEEIKNKDFEKLWRKYKAFDRKIFFFKNNKRIKITEACKTPGGLQINKLLPESRKEITLLDFENSYGKIFE